jgi:hypothetical protein
MSLSLGWSIDLIGCVSVTIPRAESFHERLRSCHLREGVPGF